MVLLVAAPAASASTLRAHAGHVSATLTVKGHPPYAPAQRLTITRAGKVLYDQPVSSKYCSSSCMSAQGTLHVVDLEHDRSPDVVLELFSGGAHCCTVLQIFSYDPERQAVRGQAAALPARPRLPALTVCGSAAGDDPPADHALAHADRRQQPEARGQAH